MLLTVFTVFIIARGGARRGGGEPASTAGELNTSGTAYDTEIPAAVPDKSYIPITDDSTSVMDTARLNAGYAILVSLDDNRALASYRADQKIYPASMTKIMTIIVAVENIENLNDTFTITSEIVNRAVAEGASRAGFLPGESVTMLDLLYGAAAPSGADATDALAISVAGSEAAFALLMNEKAAELGLVSTHFINASGLHDENHYSTVREIAAIMAYAMENELIAKLLSAASYTTSPTTQHPRGITLYNTALVNMPTTVYGRVILTAAKTGYTPEAGNCLASFATGNDGGKYILITASGTRRAETFNDCEYAYTAFIR